MAGRYDSRVFEIWDKYGLAEAMQYFLFYRIGKKYKNRFYSVELSFIWNEGFKRYFEHKMGKSSIGEFRRRIELEKHSSVAEFGNRDCINTLYFNMDEKFE